MVYSKVKQEAKLSVHSIAQDSCGNVACFLTHRKRLAHDTQEN